MLALNHVRRIEDSAGDEAVEETRKAVAQRAQRRFRTKGNVPTRHIDQFRTRPESMQQQLHLAGPERGRSKTAARKELKETWKARWTRYQQQTCTVANDNKLSVAVHATWTPGSSQYLLREFEARPTIISVCNRVEYTTESILPIELSQAIETSGCLSLDK
jgi:hypothetical protein